MNPLISVIVPVYNVENELSECIESIINQTYQKIEILLIDDGSTDSSGDICDKYNEIDDRIVSLHKKNGGVSDARNYGIAHSKGEYIICVDGDDIAKNTMIETLFSLVESVNAQIAVCPYQKFYDRGQLFEEENVYTDVVKPKEALERLLYQDRIFHTGPHCKLYKRDLFDEICYPVGIAFGEDLATTYRLILKSSRIAYTNEKLYGYRIRKKSAMRQGFSEKKMSCISVSRELYEGICSVNPDLKKAAASRAFSVNRAVYLQIPKERKNERNRVWTEMKKYRMLIIVNNRARFKERVIALCTYLGQSFFVLLSTPYQKQQMRLK